MSTSDSRARKPETDAPSDERQHGAPDALGKDSRPVSINVAAAVKSGEKRRRSEADISIRVKDFNFYYGSNLMLRNINMNIARNTVTAIIGPSGCGKSTLLRCFNRMNDLIDDTRVEGNIYLEGEDIYSPSLDISRLRQHVGMVFQRPNPFPKSVYENVCYGLRIQGQNNRRKLDDIVEKSLRGAALWDEVKDRLDSNAMSLSGGQQQRLVIARAIAIEPEVILLDEPASALDPLSTLKLEELIYQLKDKYTVVIVTHNMQQAARVSDDTAYMYMGELIEFNNTSALFTNPEKKMTEDYITGRYG